MADPAPFVLTAELLRAHRAGRTLCLDVGAVDASHTPLAAAPSGFKIVRAGQQFADPGGEPSSEQESSEEAAHPEDSDEQESSSSSDTYARGPAVALVRVSGMLMSEPDKLCGFFDGYGGAEGIVARFCEAHASAYVAGVVLWMTTPGGDAVGCGEAAATMRAAAQASGKPTLVFVDGKCLSAGYWLAGAVADFIGVTEGSDVGSIGCWTVHQDASGANEKDGLVYTYVTSRPGKIAGHGDAPLDAEGRARMQRSVDDVDARFSRDVITGRVRVGVDFEQATIDALNADTRRGPAAVSAGLADDVVSGLGDVVALCALRAAALRRPPPPADIPPPPAPNPEPQPGPAMPKPPTMSAALLAAFGLRADASPAEAERIMLAKGAALGRIEREAGTPEPDAIVGTVSAWKRDAALLPKVQQELAASRAVAEEAERVQVLDAATKGPTPKLSRREAFVLEVAADPSAADGVKRDAAGKPVKIERVAPAYAAPSTDAQGRPVGFTLAGLRAHLEAKAPAPAVELAAGPRPATLEQAVPEGVLVGATLTPQQLAALRARRPDINPEKFAAYHARATSARAAQEQPR